MTCILSFKLIHTLSYKKVYISVKHNVDNVSQLFHQKFGVFLPNFYSFWAFDPSILLPTVCSVYVVVPVKMSCLLPYLLRFCLLSTLPFVSVKIRSYCVENNTLGHFMMLTISLQTSFSLYDLSCNKLSEHFYFHNRNQRVKRDSGW